MNLSVARKEVQSKMGIPLKFVYVGLRNQREEFEGIIMKCYSSTFLIVTSDGCNKSFSYNDYIIHNLKIVS